MIELVTIDDARQQLRLDDYGSSGGPDDAWLNIFIPAISEAVLLWLKEPWRAYVIDTDTSGVEVMDSAGNPVPALDSAGLPTPKWTVRAAVLIELASQMRFREGDGDNRVQPEAGYGYILSRGATALLGGLRRSTVA